MATERDRVSDYKKAYEQATAGFGAWQQVTKNDLKVYLGDPWTNTERVKFKKQHREVMSFPLIRRLIKWISGYQRDNMLSIRFDPVERADDQTAEQLTGINTWVMQHNNGYYTISEAFEGCLKSAMNLVNVYNDREFNTDLERYGYNQFLLDPTFTCRDLKDCNYGMMRKYLCAADAKMLLPGKEAFINGLQASGQVGHDEMFPYFQRPELYGDKLLSYDEFQQRTTVQKQIILIKPLNKELVWDGSKALLNRYIKFIVNQLQIPPDMISTITRWEKTVEVSTFLEGHEVGHGIDLWGIGDFSFTPIIAYFDPDFDVMSMKLQSVVRGLVDSQKAGDKRMMNMMGMFEMQAGSGLDYEQDALVDDEDAFTTGPGQARLFQKGALAGGKARDRIVPDIPKGMFQLHDLFDRQMVKSVGVNDEMTGFAKSGNPQVAGYLAKLRMMGGLIGLKDLYGNLALSTKTIGSKLLKLYQQYPAEKVKRILNEQPSESFTKPDFGKYDAATVEGVLTDTQRNMLYADMIQLKELGLKLKDPAPISWIMLLENAPVALKGELLKQVKAQEQQKQQEQQRQRQIEEQSRNLEFERVKGEILANRGIAEERRAQALENTADAALNRTKVAAEIQDMTIGRFLELIGYAVDLEKVGQQNREVTAKS